MKSQSKSKKINIDGVNSIFFLSYCNDQRKKKHRFLLNYWKNRCQSIKIHQDCLKQLWKANLNRKKINIDGVNSIFFLSYCNDQRKKTSFSSKLLKNRCQSIKIHQDCLKQLWKANLNRKKKINIDGVKQHFFFFHTVTTKEKKHRFLLNYWKKSLSKYQNTSRLS